MIPQKRKCFILIVHYGDPAPTRRLIGQFLGGSEAPISIGVINQDNTSSNQLLPSIDSQCVRIFIPSHNLGYLGGIEYGLQQLGADAKDIVIACNNDLTVTPDTLSELLLWWPDTECVVADKAGVLNLWTGRSRISAEKTFPQKTFSILPYLHGSFLVATAGVWQRIVPSENYFLYWEDVLLSRNAQKKNISLLVLPDIGIQHDDKPEPLKSYQLYYLVRNGVHFLMTYTPSMWQWYWQIGNRLRYLYHSTHRNPPARLIQKALLDGLRGTLGKADL